MSTLTVLKEYLIGEGGYLLNDDNNGKTVMLSGAWGSGKTHFWQNEIERVQQVIEVDGNKENKYTDEKYEEGLSFKLNQKEKSCVYISLYGKDSLSELKKEVLFRASTEDDYLSDDIEAFGFNALSTIDEVGGAIAAVYKVATNMNESRRDKKGTNKLKDGGLICFDDFERKSKKVELNDLFGFISQLAIGLKCKVVIILNSDVFEGEEANIFKTVKEKTVNKFFYFKPERRELFDSVYDRTDNRYENLNEYRDDIFNSIDETEELNARIYIQVLDNCLEWIDKGYDKAFARELVLSTIYFIKTHNTLNHTYLNCEGEGGEPYYEIIYEIYNLYPLGISKAIKNIHSMGVEQFGDTRSIYEMSKKEYLEKLKKFDEGFIISEIERHILNAKSSSEVSTQIYIDYLYENENEIMEFWKYGYKLFFMDKIDEKTYAVMSDFIKSGILLPREESS